MTNEITIETDFPSASAGAIREIGPRRFEVDYKPEILPDWFQAVLDRFWDGGGVPKEYMFHVRVCNNTDMPQETTLRFLFSPVGQSYLDLPWWMRCEGPWQPLESVELHAINGDGPHLDATISLAPREIMSVASAPYESPETVDQWTRAVATDLPDWTTREIGRTAAKRPILALESPPRPLRLLASATMQGCEPTWMGLLHTARAWASDDLADLSDRVQLCVVPLTNPDGLAEGFSVINGVGEVPKFSTHLASAGEPAPLETQAMWDYLDQLRPQARIEMHAHFTDPNFTRSIGMHEVEAMPEAIRPMGRAVERALDAHYHSEGSTNRRVRIDPRIDEHDVYGVREMAERFGIVEIFLQAIAEDLDDHNADVLACVTTVASAMIRPA